MANPSPFSLLEGLAERLGEVLQPPPWFVREAQRRLVLLLNHVLMQEPEAQARLARHAGRGLETHWRQFSLRLAVTRAGLFDLDEGPVAPDLTLTVTETSPAGLGQVLLRGDQPPLRIAGDVQFAAEINWLVDHVRWDIEEDLARLLGDGPAHALGQAGRGLAGALRRFVGGRGEGDASSAAGPAR